MKRFKKGDLVAFYLIKNGKIIGLDLNILYRVVYSIKDEEEFICLCENKFYKDNFKTCQEFWDYSIWTTENGIDFVKGQYQTTIFDFLE